MIQTRLIILTCFISCFSACSSNKKPLADFEYEIITVEEQALEEVLRTPTEFKIAAHEATPSWERANLFFDSYTTNAKTIFSSGQNSEIWLLSNVTSEKDKYIFSVEKSLQSDGYQYRVSCKVSDQVKAKESFNAFAKQNAKNLARFIRDGKLEVSLIAR